MVEYFLLALEPTYFGHLISAIGKSFNEVVKMGRMVEEGLKLRKIMSYSVIKATMQAIQNGTGGMLGKKKKEDIAMVVLGSWHGPGGSPTHYTQPRLQLQTYTPTPYNPPQHYFPPPEPQYSIRPPQYHVHHAQSYAQPPPHLQWHAPAPRNPYPPPQTYRNPTGPNFRGKLEFKNERLQRKKTFTPLGEYYSSLFQRLRQLDVLWTIESKIPNPPPKNLNYSLRCACCSNAWGHDTEKCCHLKNAIQELIDTNQIVVESPEAPNINQNPLPAHAEIHIIEIVHKDGEPKKPSQSVMMIRSSEKELRKAKTLRDNPVLVMKLVTEEEAEEFLRKMKVQDYSIVEQLRKTPSQISLISLLIHIDEHRQALMKILNEAHVPDIIIVNHLEKIAKKIFESNRITFSEDELPLESTDHNRALYLPVKCENSMVTRVLVENGSSANICPLSTLNKLKFDDERIHKNNICVRGFDEGGKDSIGNIMLELTIRPYHGVPSTGCGCFLQFVVG
uniref:Uncharacterized protein n=1 Tax=Nicotiana tabacum TaxID=4097 RepID=A0A1S4B4L0_TOBAC|nr:PREDICTED: uncharacterized protein LOC107804347 [Nicotiana tabacum]